MPDSGNPVTPGRLCMLVVLASLGSPGTVSGAEPLLGSRLASRFQEPPRKDRVLQIIHDFPDDPAAQARRVEDLVARGFGGVVANVSFDGYLRSEKKWAAFRSGVETARRHGLVVWLYDEQGYPSAAAGGLTLEGHEEWEARGLLCVTVDSDGAAPVEVALPEGKVISAGAYPLQEGVGDLSRKVDLSREASGGGPLRWEREGPWRVCAFVESRLREGTHAMANLYRQRPYPNLLEREPVERFIGLTHEAYARRFAPLKERFEAIFTDEPSLMSVFVRPARYPALPWATELPDVFRERKGYDLASVLPALAADFGAEGRRARCDFWDVIGREVSENYFGRIGAWCRSAGIASTGHLLAEDDLGSHIGFYGNFYACAELLDIPGIDCLTSEPASVPWHIAKLLGSIRCTHGRARAMSETSDHAQRYRGPGDGRPVRNVTAEEIIGTAHVLYAAGITTTTSYYSWAGLDGKTVQRVNEHIGRLGTMLTGAEHVCDVAVYYPVESGWSEFVPQRQWANAPGVARIDGIYRGVLQGLSRRGRDVDVLDSRRVTRGEVEDGALAVGHERYRVLVLPAATVVPLEVLRRAVGLVHEGGVVVAAGDLPSATPDHSSRAELEELRENLFGTVSVGGSREAPRIAAKRHPEGGWGVYVPEGCSWVVPYLIDAVMERDVRFADGLPLLVSHWRRDGGHLYFVVNESPKALQATVAFRARPPAELWDPRTGAVTRLPDRAGGGLELSFPPYGAIFVAFAAATEPRVRSEDLELGRAVEAVALLDRLGAPPRLSVAAPPHVEGSATRVGVHGVKASGTRDPFPAALPVRVSGTIAEGGVDSWCFLELRFRELLDLASFRAVELVLETPARQRGSAAKCFVILVEENEDGAVADHISDMHRGLGLPGRVRTAVQLGDFDCAGWSRDPDGVLDLRRIRALRIGWGGYHGDEGERLEFDLHELNGLGLRM